MSTDRQTHRQTTARPVYYKLTLSLRLGLAKRPMIVGRLSADHRPIAKLQKLSPMKKKTINKGVIKKRKVKKELIGRLSAGLMLSRLVSRCFDFKSIFCTELFFSHP